MGFFKMLYYIVSLTTVIFLLLIYAPNLLDFEPQAYTPKLLKYEGALAVNSYLDKGKIILKDAALGPECLEFKNGEIYASLQDGRIISIKDDKIIKTVIDLSDGSKIPSRPLGFRFYKEVLYVADPFRGLLELKVDTGKVTTLVSKKEVFNGKTLSFPDDLDIGDGVVYFSDATTKWSFRNFFYGILEHENSGRVYKYNVANKKTEVLLENLYFPNGIQLSHDKKSLLIAELLKHRILRYHLSGSKKGQTDVFVELPGEPDNIRLSSRGGYWVAMASVRDVSSPSLIDHLASFPLIRKVLARTSHMLATGLDWINQFVSSPAISGFIGEVKGGSHFLSLFSFSHAVVVELGSDGKIVRSLHSNNSQFSLLSHALELNGDLYLGSFVHPYIVKVKL